MFPVRPSHLRRYIRVFLFLLAVLIIVAGGYWQADRQNRLNQALFAAIRDDDTPKAIRLLDLGADASSRDHGQRTQTVAEIWATLWQRLRSRQPPSAHPTPLIKMLAEGNAPDDGEQLVRALLDHGADPNDRDDLGYSSLSLALIYHREDIARLLLERGADVNSASRNGDTPLMLDYGDPDMPQFLLQHRANPNAVNTDGKTPLIFACEQGDLDKVRFLLQRGARIDVPGHRGESPLHIAAGKGNLPLVRILLAAHADPNRLDRSGDTPLDTALFRANVPQPTSNDLATVDLLLAHGAHRKSVVETRLILERLRRTRSH